MEERRKQSHSTKQKNRKSANVYNSNELMANIYSHMLDDLKPYKRSWFRGPHEYVGPIYHNWPAYEFKKMAQLEKFFKRIILSSDLKFDFVADVSKAQFIASQTEFGIRRRTQRSKLVLEHAAKIVSSILGEFDFDRFFECCSFGKKAAVGLAFRDSYLDKRIATLNGSKDQLEWFKVALSKDIHLHRACRKELKKFFLACVIDIKAVPKAFDKARMVAPDTVIGGFLSRGLGVYMRELLEANTDIDLEIQQQKHQQLAREGSVTGEIATLDMKRASDSFIEEHVVRLCPESWHSVLDVVRTKIGRLKLSNQSEHYVELQSYMLMGSGHTFPLQTLLFYAIVKSTLELLGSKGGVHVYGDDIILPKHMASYVIDIFDDLGFTVNEDKSFIDGPFKESCGGDFHTGIDVRPFMPEHVCNKTMCKHSYTELLHLIANGFLRRWEYCELQNTIDFVLNEIVRVQGNLCPIPEDLPETMGLYFIPKKYEQLAKKPVYIDGICRYFVLSRRTTGRKPSTERIYYWYWLRRESSPKDVLYDAETVAGTLSSSGEEPVKGRFKYKWQHYPPVFGPSK